jgi:tetratricopeptide (TPR) repeat protein
MATASENAPTPRLGACLFAVHRRRLLALLAPFAVFIAAPAAGTASAEALVDAASAQLAVGAFDQAADTWEQLARDVPSSAAAPSALADASLLRLGLGQLERADADAGALERIHGERRPDLVIRVTLARARRHAGLGAWDALRVLLARVWPSVDRRAYLDDRLEAHALLGRALARAGKPDEALAAHRRVIALASRHDPAERGADAVGEARFSLAEEERAKADRILLRPYAGKGDRAGVLAYINGPVARWFERKRHALEVADRAYLHVLGKRPWAGSAGILAALETRRAARKETLMTTQVTADRVRRRHPVLVPLVAGTVLAVLPSPVWAAGDAGTGPVEITCAALAMVAPLAALIPTAFSNKAVYVPNHTGFEVALFIGGALGLGLGATGIALQTRHTGGCDASCKPVYGFSAGGMAFGALAIGMGIASAIKPTSLHGASRLTPLPVLLPTERGPVVGVGISGLVF